MAAAVEGASDGLRGVLVEARPGFVIMTDLICPALVSFPAGPETGGD